MQVSQHLGLANSTSSAGITARKRSLELSGYCTSHKAHVKKCERTIIKIDVKKHDSF